MPVRVIHRILWGATLAYWLGLFVLTHLPVALPVVVVRSDKTAHFYGYLVLAGGVYASLRAIGWRNVVVVTLAVVMCYGALDEWTQPLVGRTCELNDWFADAAGAAFAVTLAGLIDAWRGRPGRRSW